MTAVLELGDGSVSIDLMAAPYFAAREVRLAPPPVEAVLDGLTLSAVEYGPRTVRIELNPRASTVGALRDALRSLERFCGVGESRSLARREQVRLTCSLDGSSAGSVSYRVIRGDVDMANTLLREPSLSVAAATGVRVRLLVEPLGRLAAVSIPSTTIANEQGDSSVNYIDLTRISGSRGAHLQLKLADNDGPSAAGPVWIARRSGPGFDDELMLHGGQESTVSITDDRIWQRESGPESATYTEYTTTDVSESTASGGAAGGFRVWTTQPPGRSVRHISQSDTHVGTHRYEVSDPPDGRFKVLVRWKHDNNIGGDAMGAVRVDWTYGELTGTAGQSSYGRSGSFATEDLGDMALPPVPTPSGYGPPDLNLDVFHLYKTTQTFEDDDPWAEWSIDYVMLLPVDEGLVVLEGMPTGGSALLDTLSGEPSVYLVDSGDAVLNTLESTGKAFDIGPESTRIYVVRDDARDPGEVRTVITGSYTPLVAGL